MRIFWLLAAALLLAALQGALLRRAGLRRLFYARSFSRKSAFAGERVELLEVLENPSPLPIPYLRAESRISSALRLGQAESAAGPDERVLRGEMYHCSLFFLRGFSRITRRHPVLLLRRGYFSAASVSLTARDLFGLQTASRELDTGAAIAVYPRLLPEGEVPPLCRQLIGELLVRRYIQPDPFLISGARPFRPGDAPRDVDWRATARAGEIMARACDYTAEPCLLVALNVQKAEDQWGDLSAPELACFEEAVSLAATLCLQVLRGGGRAGFAANTDAAGQPSLCATLMPLGGAAQAEAILELLSRLTLRRAANFYTFLEALDPPADADVLILSRYDSARIEGALSTMRARGHGAHLQLLAGGEGDEAARA